MSKDLMLIEREEVLLRRSPLQETPAGEWDDMFNCFSKNNYY